jgi:SAM-dependent methyltransferase
MTMLDAQSIWDRLSASYQAQHALTTESAHYGPWAPLENELRLLGDVRNRHILELGCGGGQSSVAFARQGAVAAGLDISVAQLEFARYLATSTQVDVQFVQGTANDLCAFATGAWDFVFSTYALHYVADMPRCLAECHRVLVPSGRLVFSLDHPARHCFFDADEDELSIVPVRSYFESGPEQWRWPGRADLVLQSFHYTIAEWMDMLYAAGFCLVRLLEPVPSPEMLDATFPSDGALAPLRLLPQSIIFVAEKR